MSLSDLALYATATLIAIDAVALPVILYLLATAPEAPPWET